MDLTSKRMFDIFHNQIWKDLGPLDPNWFESLTTEGLAGHVSDQDELCANQEALFKAPIENKGLCSQMCSTPKLFKHHQTSSFQTENESFSSEPEMLSWTKASPCVLQIEPSQMANLLFHSPKSTDAKLHRSPGQTNSGFAQHISERLGATVGDMSWTSSLNTPPPEPSTLILSRKETSSTVTISEGTFGLVRNLFPSNSSVSADGHIPESPEQSAPIVLDTELNRSLPAPVKDKPVPSPTEDVHMHKEVDTESATFCTQSSSILRKVRNERVNRRLIIPSNEKSHGTVKVSPRRTAVFCEDRSSEPLSDNTVLSQWSPLNLSDIMPHSKVSRGKQVPGPIEMKHEKDNALTDDDLEAELKFPSSEQNQGNSVDNLIEKTLQRSQVSFTTSLPNDFSPAACLSALKRAKQRAKQGMGYQQSEIVTAQDPAFIIKQCSVHDSGLSSVAETALLLSTNKSPLKLNTTVPVTELDNRDCEAIHQSLKGNENVSEVEGFKTASNKNINKHFFNNIQEKENAQHCRSDASTGDFHLTVSQKAEVKELCALLEQQSASQFDFTQPPVEIVNRECQNKQYPSLKSENILLTVESASNEATLCHFKIGDLTENHFEEGSLNTCQGFKTASGERISVSAKSIQKSKNVFKDCEDDGFLLNICCIKNESGFKTTSEVGNIYSKEDNMENGSSNHNSATFRKPCLKVFDSVKANENTKPLGKNETPVHTPRRGFKRAHDTHPVSNKSVKRAKLLLSDYEGEENIKPHYSKQNSISHATNKIGETGIKNDTSLSGFTSAGGKELQLPKKKIEKVKHIWKDFDDSLKTANGAPAFESSTESQVSNVEHDSEEQLLKTKPLQPEQTRFQTSPQSSGDRMTVASSPALTKNNGVWTKQADREYKAHLKPSDPYENLKDLAVSTSGFLLASGKALEVSAEALLKAKAMFDDISSTSKTREASQMPKAVMLAERTESFTTQKNNTIKATSKNDQDCSSLRLSKLSTECESTPNPDQDSCLLGIGFTTASGKKVAVSEEALNVAQRLLTEVADSRNGLQDILPRKTTSCNEPQFNKDFSKSKSSSPNPVSSDKHGFSDTSGAALATGKPVQFSSSSVLAKALQNTATWTDNKSSVAKSPACAQRHKAEHSSHIEMNSTTTADANVLKKKKKDGSDLAFGCSVTVLDDALAKTNTSGFTTASGKKVTVSEDALNKAMICLTEKVDQDCDVNVHKKTEWSLPNGHLMTNLDHAQAPNISCMKTSTSGFTTASGKKVKVSEEALNKAIYFLTDKVEQDSDANVHITKKTKDGASLPPPHSIANLDNTSSNISSMKNYRSEFITASGKKATISEEALNQGMFCLAEKVDQDSDANLHMKKKESSLPIGHLTTNLGHAQAPNISYVKNCSSGYTTASGQKVTISEEALNKAMIILTEKVEQDSNVNFNATKKHKDGSRLSLGHAGHNLDYASSDISCVKTSRNGFTTASGRKVTVSEEALNKAMNSLSEKVDHDSDACVYKNKKDSHLPLGHFVTNLDDSLASNNPLIKTSTSGFTTASGKKVTVSEEALSKAMNFLTEKIGQDSDANIPVQKENKDGLSLPIGHAVTKMCNKSSDISCVKTSKSGFAMASGKKVHVSEEALNKAMNFLTEKVEQDSDANFHVTKRSKDSSSLPLEHRVTKLNPTPASNLSCVKTSKIGFATASGKKVIVSEEALNKAMDLLTEKVDLVGDNKPLTAELVPKECNTTELQSGFVQPEFANRIHQSLDSLISDLSPSVKIDVIKVPSVSRNINKDAKQFSEYKQHKSPHKESPQHCSMVNLDAPNLSNCTTTQQKFLAQEALDCTRALLEDEVRAAQSLMASFEQIPTPAPEGSQNHRGKRHLEDVSDLPGLGGKSSEDYDRGLDRRKDTVLNPVKSCLTGFCKDRRVLQYHVPLHPNITKSPRFGKDYVKTQKLTSVVPSTPAKSGQADLKTPLFVPPFLNTRAKAPKGDNSAQRDNKTPCTFVPPFKKLKPEGISTKTKDKEGGFVKESPKTGTFIPPTKKNTGNDCSSKPDKDPTNERSPQSEATSETEDALEGFDQKATEQKETTEAEERQQRESLLSSESVDLARDLQNMRIRKKSRQTIRPIPGSLFLTKSSQKRHSFRAVVDGQTPEKHSPTQLYTYGVDRPVCQITSETAEEFCFNLFKFCKRESISEAGGVQLADGGWLVPRRDGTVGKEEFYRALCDTAGVDPKLLSQGWVSNHYRWVVWKLASMERSFPASMASVCLTPEQVLLQLKYRYDIEVDRSRRPCLRKIMERDDTSAKTLVLCVCGTVSTGQPSPRTPQDTKVKPESCGAVVWLTDGWYSIKGQLDVPLSALLHRGALSEGVKLITHGAQLVGSQEACAPLEAPETLLLKIFANSTRRARWDTKLGFYKDPRPFVIPLSSVFSAGGVVSCVDMVILRVYPIQWMERTPDRGVVFRSERAEEKEARRYNNHKQKTMEAVYARIKVEFEKEEKEKMKSQGRRQTVRREDLCRCQDGEELFEAVGDEADVEAFLTPEQLQSLSAYRQTLLDQRNAALQVRLRRAVEEAEASEGSCPRRDTATVWRLCITDYREQPGGTVYQLSVWNPSSDLQAVLKEGCRYEATNLAASEGRTQSGRATVQLTSTRKTHFRNLQASPERLLTCFQPRVSVTFSHLQKPGFMSLCGEVDLTGCVISITDQDASSPAFYLVDGCLDFVKVHSLVSFVRCGWEEVLELHGLVCLSNLQVRVGCASPTPVLYAGDMSALSTHPRENHLKQALGQLQQAIQKQGDFFVKAEKRLFEIMSSNGLSFSAVNPRTPQSTKTGHDQRTSIATKQAPGVTPTVQTPAPPNSLTKKDPRSLKRRRALDYLCQFPPPPPLSHLSSAASPSVKKTFLPPRRSLPPSSTPGTAAPPPRRSSAPGTAAEEEGWVHDDELAMIDTQELRAADALSD